MTSINAAFQPVKFAITKWRADVSPRFEEYEEETLKRSIRWSFALSVTPLPPSDPRVLSSQLGLHLKGIWDDMETETEEVHPSPFSFETLIIGVFTYTIDDTAELRTSIEDFVRFLKRNGTAYLYSTLRPEVRNFFLTAIGRQILLPAVNMNEAFKSFDIPVDDWVARYERKHQSAST